VRFLLEHGARLDVGRSALLSAMRPFVHSQFEKENVEIVKMLIEAGANVNDKDDQGYTPLAISAMYNQKELVQYLIDHGAKVNVKNKDGRTPLMEAVDAVEGAKSEDTVLEVVKIMLKADANPNAAPDQYGNTAISIANKKNFPKVVAEIQKTLFASQLKKGG
jgi:ankyrin repeat protein